MLDVVNTGGQRTNIEARRRNRDLRANFLTKCMSLVGQPGLLGLIDGIP